MWKKIRWNLLGLALLIALAILWSFPGPPDSHPSQSLVRLSTVKSVPLRLQANLDRNRLEDNAPDPLQITVSNDSDRSLSALHLALSAPGFALDQSNLRCTDPASAATVDPLPPHRSCRFGVDLTPAARSGTYGITVFVDWRQADGADHASLLLAPVIIDQNWGAARWTRMGRRLSSLLKDLTLPILLAGLGAFFARRQSARDAEIRAGEAARIKRENDTELARVDAEKEKERIRIEAEKVAEQKRIDAEKDKEELRRASYTEQAERQDVRHLLLTRVMELAEQHYLLFVNHGRLILLEAGKIRAGKPDAAPDKLFLQVLFLLKRMEVFRLSKGGIFFKTRAGERCVGAAWFLLKTKIYAALGDKNTADALNRVKTDWDYAAFKAEFTNLANAWTAFEKWRNEPENSTALTGSFWHILGTVDAFQAIMAFEADRALSKHWYEEEGKVVFLLPAPTVLYCRNSAEDYEKTKTSELEALLRDPPYGRMIKLEQLP